MPAICSVCSEQSAGGNSGIKFNGCCDRIFHWKYVQDDAEGRKLRLGRHWKCSSCKEPSSLSNVQSASGGEQLTKDFLFRVMNRFCVGTDGHIKVYCLLSIERIASDS